MFVRQDISFPQQVVQSCHAAIEAANAFSLGDLPDHPSVIVIGVQDEDALSLARTHLVENGVRHVHFYESDMQDELTAIATEPVHGERRKLFRKYPLLRLKGGAL